MSDNQPQVGTCPTCGSDDRDVRKTMYHPTEDAQCFDSWHDPQPTPAEPRIETVPTRGELLDALGECVFSWATYQQTDSEEAWEAVNAACEVAQKLIDRQHASPPSSPGAAQTCPTCSSPQKDIRNGLAYTFNPGECPDNWHESSSPGAPQEQK